MILMKQVLLVLLAFFFFSCNKETIDELDSNSKELKVVGKKFDENGSFTSDIFIYNNLNLEVEPISLIKVHTQNYSHISYNAFYADKDGITGSGRNFDSGKTHVYFEKFDSNSGQSIVDIPIEGKLLYSFHANEKVYAFFEEDYVEGIVGTNYKLLIFDVENKEEKIIQIGNFPKIWDDFIRLVPIDNQLYVYLGQYPLDENPKNYLILFDLVKEEIIETRDDFNFDKYAIVGDNLGNCYLLGNDNIYKYEYIKNTLTNLGTIGSGHFNFNYYLDPRNPMKIIDDKLFFGTLGGFPGTGATYPAILNLKSGDFNIIDIFENETKFEGDEIAWNPHAESFALDYKNKVFLIGVHSSRIGMPYKSQGIFTVDFEGNVLSKIKTPIVPFQIIN